MSIPSLETFFLNKIFLKFLDQNVVQDYGNPNILIYFLKLLQCSKHKIKGKGMGGKDKGSLLESLPKDISEDL